MASSAPIFVRPHEYADDEPNDEETPLLYGFASTSARRPFSTSFIPTLYTRAIALILALPAFIIFVIRGPHYSGSIVFLSFAIARQAFILGSFFGSQFMVIKVEVVHDTLRAMHARVQEKWVQRVSGLLLDGVVLLGLLISLAVDAREIAICRYGCRPSMVTTAVILGFIVFGLLLLSLPDCGMPYLFTMVLKVEKPVSGIWKVTSSAQFGKPEDEEESEEVEDAEAGMSGQDTRKGGVV